MSALDDVAAALVEREVEIARLTAELDATHSRWERWRDAILNVREHATPLGEDEDGFVATGYLVSIGAMHRMENVVHDSPEAFTTRQLLDEAIALLRDREGSKSESVVWQRRVDDFLARVGEKGVITRSSTLTGRAAVQTDFTARVGEEPK